MKVIEKIFANDIEHQKILEETGFWGKRGAGCLVFAKASNKFLIGYRSNFVQEPNTWGTWGGAIDDKENPQKAAIRELKEETGYTGNIEAVIAMLVFQKASFKYFNYLIVINKEFLPVLNCENKDFRWVCIGDWPTPMHPGMKSLIEDKKSIEIMKQVSKCI